ncbi:hypothetical protein SBRCBS47491_005980 [Sporothrix bragantina]|uniref:Heterokaryon incompatibility domain-containing protein n=1 Tax=Sporothrix bragantina TaxID=671064 RepID=A0ABP0C262_9PEZI
MAFEYRDLDVSRNEFRLLRLRPAASLDAPLRIRLFHANLDDAPEYEALSYVWGKQWGQFTVHVEDDYAVDSDDGDLAGLTTLPITPNLDMALRHLRYRIKTSADGSAAVPHDRILWVDALCINQQDPVERSRQVQQMRRIYELCVADVAWLGPNPSPPLTKKQVENTRTDSEDSDSEKEGPVGTRPPAGEKIESETDELAQEHKRAKKWAKKLAKAETNRVAGHRRRAQKLRDGLALMRQVADRDVKTLSQMVQLWNQQGSSIWFAINDMDDDNKPMSKSKDEFDPADPGQKRFLTSGQVQSLYATFSYAKLWSRVWVVQELSCAPRVLLGVGRQSDSEGEQQDGDTSTDNKKRASKEEQNNGLDMLETIDWDKDIVGGFLDDTTFSDAFHSAWGHGSVGPVAANIFARPRAIQLQRRMLHSQRTAGRRVALSGFEGIPQCAVRRTTIKEQSMLEEEELWKAVGDEARSRSDDKAGGAKALPLADPSLINVLARFKWTLATDPRDKVYGLMGLVAEAPLLPPVDYTQPTARVYGDAALTILQTSGSLDLISQNPFDGQDGQGSEGESDSGDEDDVNRRAPNLPSWAPNFDRSVYTDYHDEFATILFAQRGIYAAGKRDCKHLFPLDVQDGWVEAMESNGKGSEPTRRPVRCLRLRGTVLGRVAHLKQGSWEEKGRDYIPPESSVELFRRFKVQYYGEEKAENTGLQNEVYAPTGERLWDAFWRTVVGDCTAYPIRRLTAEEQAQCSTGLAEMCRLREAEIRKKEEDTHNLTTEKEWAEYLDRRNNYVYPASAKLLGTLPVDEMLRRMIRRWGVAQTVPDSSKPGGMGGLLLMVRSTAQAGDMVAVLDGSKVPVVLRELDATVFAKDGQKKDGAYYKYVCPAYVHGYMDGQAIAQVADGRLVEQDIVLV